MKRKSLQILASQSTGRPSHDDIKGVLVLLALLSAFQVKGWEGQEDPVPLFTTMRPSGRFYRRKGMVHEKFYSPPVRRNARVTYCSPIVLPWNAGTIRHSSPPQENSCLLFLIFSISKFISSPAM